MTKKKVTIEDLAGMTQRGFEQVDKRFEQVDKRFEQVETRLGQIDTRLDRIENRLIGGHENRIERLEDDMRVMKTTMGK